MARDGVIIFRDLVAKLDVLNIECDKCDRKGRYHVHRLIECYGIDAKLFERFDEIRDVLACRGEHCGAGKRLKGVKISSLCRLCRTPIYVMQSSHAQHSMICCAVHSTVGHGVTATCRISLLRCRNTASGARWFQRRRSRIPYIRFMPRFRNSRHPGTALDCGDA
jgi:hypothetical protein